MIVQKDRHPHLGYSRRYNDLTDSEVVAIVPTAEDGNDGRRDIVPRRGAELNSNVNELLDAVSTTKDRMILSALFFFFHLCKMGGSFN